MRLFVALNFPAEERARMAAAVEPLRASGLPVRWVDQDAYHLTLKFLGEVDTARAGEIITALQELAPRHAPLALRIRGAGAFPNLRRPAVWWLGIEPLPALAALQQDVERAVAKLGFEPEPRPFSPHLTLGRTSRDARPAALADAPARLQRVELDRTITVDSVDLMRSQLSPRGARYERLVAAALRS